MKENGARLTSKNANFGGFTVLRYPTIDPLHMQSIHSTKSKTDRVCGAKVLWWIVTIICEVTLSVWYQQREIIWFVIANFLKQAAFLVILLFFFGNFLRMATLE